MNKAVSRLRVALGTFVAVQAEAHSQAAAQTAVVAAFDAIARVERHMHPTRPGSDLAQLAACTPGTTLQVHAWTWEVLELCQRINRTSFGAFDPCLDSLPGRLSDLELLSGAQVIAHAPVQVDLGGIAKGYAVDRAIEALRANGCRSGLVNAGGDLAVFGARTYTIVCRQPQGDDLHIELRDAALASSNTQQVERPAEHRGYYHAAKRSVAVTGQATVLARCAAVADALTKCVLLGDSFLSRTVLDAFAARQIHGALESQP